MGHYRDGNYYRGEQDAELQWLEDGAGLVGQLIIYGVCAFAVGVFQLLFGLIKLVTSDDAT
jgi:hypothetical protein